MSKITDSHNWRGRNSTLSIDKSVVGWLKGKQVSKTFDPTSNEQTQEALQTIYRRLNRAR